MYRIVYIIPYFGKMRNDFNIWLKSCSYNNTIDFLIFTDDHNDYNYPANVYVKYIALAELKLQIEEKLGFNIAMSHPYKFCDLKPAYGDIFSDYISEYDFWGHCDTDLIWGDIRTFITDEILSKYEKIGFLGHSTLYKNTKEINLRYRISIDGCETNYKKVFQNEQGFHFDEGFMNKLYKTYNWPLYSGVHFADLTEYRYNFFLTNIKKELNHSRQIFVWEKGHLLRYYLHGHKIYKDEFMYIHFLKRNMALDVNLTIIADKLIIYPNIITDSNIDINYRFINKVARPRWTKYFFNLYQQKKDTIKLSNLFKRTVHRLKKYYMLSHNNDKLNDLENWQ